MWSTAISEQARFTRLKELLAAAAGGGAITRAMVFGIVSLILWALIVVVTIKYVLFILGRTITARAGTLTLMALAQRAMGHNVLVDHLAGHGRGGTVLRRCHHYAGDFRALGGGGTESRHPRLYAPYVLPLSLLVLLGLVCTAEPRYRPGGRVVRPDYRRCGSSSWRPAGSFTSADDPSILAALSPTYGVAFLATMAWRGFLLWGQCSLP